MAGLLQFDAQRLEQMVNTKGLKKTWLDLLATHIKSFGKFDYILAEDDYRGHKILDENLLEALSIGEIGVLYEFCIAHQDASSRKDNGQYFTPDDVALFMVSKAKEFPVGRWLDPCSGVGNLSWHLVNSQRYKEKFLLESMILSDRDELALLIARTLFTLSFQKEHEFLFKELEGNFIKFDFLSVADSSQDALFSDSGLADIPQHDFVIVNPPYLALKKRDFRFETADSADLYAYFLENIVKSSKGFISVTPQSFTNAGKFEELRRLLLTRCNNLTIYNFDNIPGNIFHGVKFGSKNSNKANSIRAAVTVAKPGADSRRITSLMRWKTSEREEMFLSIDEFLSETSLSEEFFPKVSKVFEELYIESRSWRNLGDLISREKTAFALYIATAPRYFISALKKPVSRTSLRTLYFDSESELNVAYLLLNSSFTYWWWRVRDGGMTLALETLKSLPVPDFAVNESLIKELEKSELSNRVVKRNAGADQENVKHSDALVSSINDLVLPEYSTRLMATHQNSELVQLDFVAKQRKQQRSA